MSVLTRRLIQENTDRLMVLDYSKNLNAEETTQAIRRDFVVLIQNAEQSDAGRIFCEISNGFGLNQSQRKYHREFTQIEGHRQKIDPIFMSVNKRPASQFIPPHSEGSSFTGVQLSAFYCIQNDTDGGETILFSVNSESNAWSSLREVVMRAKLEGGSRMNPAIAQQLSYYKINFKTDYIRKSDHVFRERKSVVAGLKFFDVLAKPIKSYSKILDTKKFVYWDSIGSLDTDSSRQFIALLRENSLLRSPTNFVDPNELDNALPRRIWRSGVELGELFHCKITRKLAPRDFIVFNNFTWAHAAANWTEGKGTRNIAASFA